MQLIELSVESRKESVAEYCKETHRKHWAADSRAESGEIEAGEAF